MKKNWVNPEIESMAISSTAGGPTDPDKIDGVAEWNPEMNRWEWPAGISE